MEYNYTNPELMFAGFGIAALIFAIWLKILNTKHGYGLESPNIKSKLAEEAEVVSAEE